MEGSQFIFFQERFDQISFKTSGDRAGCQEAIYNSQDEQVNMSLRAERDIDSKGTEGNNNTWSVG